MLTVPLLVLRMQQLRSVRQSNKDLTFQMRVRLYLILLSLLLLLGGTAVLLGTSLATREKDSGQASSHRCNESAEGLASFATVSGVLPSCVPPAPALGCSAQCHVCGIDAKRGCGSCHRLCHADCRSSLCSFELCEFCFSYGVTTHVSSEVCGAVQEQFGPHGSSVLTDGEKVSASLGNPTVESNLPALSSDPGLVCSPSRHLCSRDSLIGCASCNQMCHADCSSVLCALEPCEYCLSLRIVTHANSSLCLEVQRDCPFHGVICLPCGEVLLCPSCDSVSHRDNRDPACPFYARDRIVHADAVATGSSAPDMFERSAVTLTQEPYQLLVTIHGSSGDKVFVKGSASGAGNNCLIDSLRQAIDMHFPLAVHTGWIREQLQVRFPSTHPYAVSQRNFLDLRNHWEAVVQLILESARAQGCALPRHMSADSFEVISVEEQRRVIGDQVGSGPVSLYLLNEGFLHFVPLIRLRLR